MGIHTWLACTIKGKLYKHLISKLSTVRVAFSTILEVGREQGVLPISVVFSTVHEVGREQGVLTISVVFSTVLEVGRVQGVLTISVVFSTVLEVGREQVVLTIQEYVISLWSRQPSVTIIHVHHRCNRVSIIMYMYLCTYLLVSMCLVL